MKQLLKHYLPIFLCAILISVSGFFWYAQTARAAIARVQPATPGSVTQGVCSGSTTDLACTFTSTPTVGNTVLVWCFSNTAKTWTTPTDNKGTNVYNAVAGASASQASVWWSTVAVSSATFTITCHATVSDFLTMLIQEYSGITNSSPIDQSNKGSGSGTAMSPGAITTTNANDLIISGCTNSNTGSGTATFTPVAGFTIENQQTDDSNWQTAAVEDQIVSATGTYTASMTYSIDANNTWQCGVISLKATGGAVSTPHTNVTIRGANVTVYPGANLTITPNK